MTPYNSERGIVLKCLHGDCTVLSLLIQAIKTVGAIVMMKSGMIDKNKIKYIMPI